MLRPPHVVVVVLGVKKSCNSQINKIAIVKYAKSDIQPPLKVDSVNSCGKDRNASTFFINFPNILNK